MNDALKKQIIEAIAIGVHETLTKNEKSIFDAMARDMLTTDGDKQYTFGITMGAKVSPYGSAANVDVTVGWKTAYKDTFDLRVDDGTQLKLKLEKDGAE